MKVAIIGAGFTGLTAAFRLSRKGHKITIFEKEKFCGGLAAGFQEKNWDWHLEYFFHHLFTSDSAAKNLISELGLLEKLFYLRPKTSIFYEGKISQFDSPFSLLSFPFLSIPEKLRTGLVTAYLKLLKTPRMVAVRQLADMTPPRWKGWKFENISAFNWLQKYYGKKPFEILWKPLLLSKFGDQAKEISMAWFWARIKKRSTRLGYLEGGFQVLIDRLTEKIKTQNGEIHLNSEVKRLNDLNHFNKIIITTSTQTFFKTKLPEMLGAINLILVLKEKFLVDGTYWLNINEPGFPFVAVVEHTNFVNKKYYGGNHILYVGGYYPQNHPYFKMTKEEIFQEFLPYLQRINPSFNFTLHASHFTLHTNLFAQPIVPVNYSSLIPSHQTPIPNVFLANMQQVYPWDRGTNYAIELGEEIAEIIIKEGNNKPARPIESAL
ncbi:MAG: NAD(P)/FAD-dependent oxidoreductase [Patescibacteria group bacterium]